MCNELEMRLNTGATIKAVKEHNGIGLWIGDKCVAYLDGFYANENGGEADKLPLMIHNPERDEPIMRVDFYSNRTTFDVINETDMGLNWNTRSKVLSVYNDGR